AVGRQHRRRGGGRRHVRLGDLVCTPDAVRPRGPAGTRLGCLGARRSGWLRGDARLAPGSGMTGPQRAEQEENAPQSHKPAVGEQERRHHGNAPADVGALRALSWSCALIDLSAAVLSTTPLTWYERSRKRLEDTRLPQSTASRDTSAQPVGEDGCPLRDALDAPETPAGLR